MCVKEDSRVGKHLWAVVSLEKSLILFFFIKHLLNGHKIIWDTSPFIWHQQLKIIIGVGAADWKKQNKKERQRIHSWVDFLSDKCPLNIECDK